MYVLVLMMDFFIFICFFLFVLNYLISKKKWFDRSKSSPFECGFEILESIRLPFSIHFYLMGVLFLIFDVEFIYLFSMVLSMNYLFYKLWFYCSGLILLILFLGLEYEKKEGSLKWFI